MDSLEKYISEITSAEDDLLKELDRETNLRVVQPKMISGHVQGKLLELLTKIIKPKNVLEIGTFTGYSTLCFAAGLQEGGVVDTIEVDDELESLSSSFFARSPHGYKIRQHIGSALEIAPSLGKVYDLIFIDGDKREYKEYYKMIMGDEYSSGIFCGANGSVSMKCAPLVRKGSVILADNILWYGKVAGPISEKDLYTRSIDDFNRLVAEDERVENVVLPIRDGINMVRVK